MTTPPFSSPSKDSVADLSTILLDEDILEEDAETSLLSKMDRYLVKGKVIEYTTVSFIYEECWSDPSFYKSWLTSRDNTDIVVGAWEEGASEDTPISYQDELFQKKRVVTFKSARALSSVTSPTNKVASKVVVGVTEIQHCRVEDDRVIIATQVKQTNVPFADSFTVHWRWVGTNLELKKVLIRVGFSVDVAPHVMLADTIRKQQGDFSLQRHIHLFRAIKHHVARSQPTLAMKDPWHKVTGAMRLFFPFWVPEETVTTIPHMIDKVAEQIRLLELSPVPSETTEALQSNLKRLKITRDSLKGLLKRETDFVIKSNPDEDRNASGGLPPILLPLVKAVGNLHVDNPLEKYAMKEVVSEAESKMKVQIVGPPWQDSTLDTMAVFTSKIVANCTVEDFKVLLLSSDTRWYESWITLSGRSDVQIPAWTEESTVDKFSGETFPYRRQVTCRFDKSIYNTSLDPSVAAVPATQIQTQCLRYDDENAVLIWSTTTTVEGMAYADAWQAHVRWVVSAAREDAVHVQVGVLIDILKPVMTETQLRSGAETTTRDRQNQLLTAIRGELKARHAKSKRPHPVIEKIGWSLKGAVDRVQHLLHMYPDRMLRDEPDWGSVLADIRGKLSLLQQLLRHTGRNVAYEIVQNEARYVFQELEQVKDILREILEEVAGMVKDPDESATALDQACFSPGKTRTFALADAEA